nr:hypothetical protein [Azospirillum agricola]
MVVTGEITERGIRFDVTNGSFKLPVSLQRGGARPVRRSRNISAGQRRQIPDESQSIAPFGDVAAVDQQVAVRGEGAADGGEVGAVGGHGGLVERNGAEIDIPFRTVADDVNGVITAVGLCPLSHLRQAVLGRIEQHHFHAGLRAVDQGLIIGDVGFDEDDFLSAAVQRRVGRTDFHGGDRSGGWGGGSGRERDRLRLIGGVRGVVRGGGRVGGVVGRRGVGGGGPGGVEHEARLQREGQRWSASPRPGPAMRGFGFRVIREKREHRLHDRARR